ncbi:ester cyclase [Caballeronia sordidicola]|uniref:Ester cyclase n=1 Tax=Caballeronia sordidicola TaxID=196367 RepID=A0A242M6X2_CABSO|nr:ester cyclase [Caballeronia sordidicola]OTP66583.1 protein of unknown function DUF1486 [Caballeronia sordidicola]
MFAYINNRFQLQRASAYSEIIETNKAMPMNANTRSNTNQVLNEEERSAIKILYEAFSSGNPDLLDKAVADDWQDIPLAPGQQPGRDGMKPLIRAFVAAFPDIQIEVHDIIGNAQAAGVRAEISGTHSGEWFGVAPTGKRFHIALHEFHRLKDGKITHTWHLEDWFGWMNQVGIWPAKNLG